MSPHGSKLFVSGTQPAALYDVFSTQALRAAGGALLWTHIQNHHPDTATALAQVNAMTVDPSGPQVLITGQTSNNTTGAFSFVTIAYGPATGIKLWYARFSLSPQGIGAVPRAIVVSPDGSKVFVTGAAQNPAGTVGFATVAYSA